MVNDNDKKFFEWMLTPSAAHSTLMENDEGYRKNVQDSYLYRYPECFKDKDEK